MLWVWGAEGDTFGGRGAHPPPVQAGQIQQELETHFRGVYTAVVYIPPGGLEGFLS